MINPERRRRRPAVSCALCRRRKIRCNRQLPCNNCLRSSKRDSCIYEDHPPLPQQQNAGAQGADTASIASITSTLWSHSTTAWTPNSTDSSATAPISPHEFESMKRQIRRLEEQLCKSTSLTASSTPNPRSTIETTSSSFGGTFSLMSRSISHKKRLFGQSHWMNGFVLFRDIIEMLEPCAHDENSGLVRGLRKAKALARAIKAQRAPPWPTTPTTDLPSRDVADELVDAYLRTFETVFRILHVPTFRRDYEALWIIGVTGNTAFLVQLKLILAIGATVHDDHFTLRSLATRWVYEALTWFSAPVIKSRLGLQYLQTGILLLVAREQVNVCEEVIWVSTGALLRIGISMGLHRDPTRLPSMSVFEAEMRRRIWNTILELALQSSLVSGGPCLLSLTDFDTEPPSNFDDEQLVSKEPMPKTISVFTQTSVAIAFRKTLPVRLAIIKALNDIGASGAYEETLAIDIEVRAAYKSLRQTLQAYESPTAPRPSGFDLRLVDFIMHRYLSALHLPFFTHRLHDPGYTYSRKVVVESSFKLWRAAWPTSVTQSVQTDNRSYASSRDDLSRITTNGSGFFRYATFLAGHHLLVELRSQIQEEESIRATPPRTELLDILEEAKLWNLGTIEAGETSIKGYLLSCLFAAQIHGLLRGLKGNDIQDLLVSAANESQEQCISLLETMAGQDIPEETSDSLGKRAWFVWPEQTDDWDLISPDSLLNSQDIGSGEDLLNCVDVQDLFFNL